MGVILDDEEDDATFLARLDKSIGYVPPPKKQSTNPALEKMRKAQKRARAVGLDVPDDIVDDFYDVTGHESGRSHFIAPGRVKLGPRTNNGEQAIGFSQIMPGTAKPYQARGLNPQDEIDNIAMGMAEYYRGDKSDGIARRLAYVGGPESKALAEYRRTGKVPKTKLYSYLPNSKETYHDYVERTGGFKRRAVNSDDVDLLARVDKIIADPVNLSSGADDDTAFLERVDQIIAPLADNDDKRPAGSQPSPTFPISSYPQPPAAPINIVGNLTTQRERLVRDLDATKNVTQQKIIIEALAKIDRTIAEQKAVASVQAASAVNATASIQEQVNALEQSIKQQGFAATAEQEMQRAQLNKALDQSLTVTDGLRQEKSAVKNIEAVVGDDIDMTALRNAPPETQEEVEKEFEEYLAKNNLPRTQKAVDAFNADLKKRADAYNLTMTRFDQELTGLKDISQASKAGMRYPEYKKQQDALRKEYDEGLAAGKWKTTNEFNAELRRRDEAARAESDKKFLTKNPKYAEFLQKNNFTHSQESIEKYNAQLPKRAKAAGQGFAAADGLRRSMESLQPAMEPVTEQPRTAGTERDIIRYSSGKPDNVSAMDWMMSDVASYMLEKYGVPFETTKGYLKKTGIRNLKTGHDLDNDEATATYRSGQGRFEFTPEERASLIAQGKVDKQVTDIFTKGRADGRPTSEVIGDLASVVDENGVGVYDIEDLEKRAAEAKASEDELRQELQDAEREKVVAAIRSNAIASPDGKPFRSLDKESAEGVLSKGDNDAINKAAEEQFWKIVRSPGGIESYRFQQAEKQAVLKKNKEFRDQMQSWGVPQYTVPLQVASNIGKGTAQVVTDLVSAYDVLSWTAGVPTWGDIGQFAKDIFDKGIDARLGNTPADQRPGFTTAQALQKWWEDNSYDDPLFHTDRGASMLLNDFPKLIPQLVVQTAAAIATGGAVAPTAIGASQGLMERYKEARENGATDGELRGIVLSSAMLAVPEYFANKIVLGPLSKLGKPGLDALATKTARQLYAEFSREVGEVEARNLTGVAMKGIMGRIYQSAKTYAPTVLKGMGTEAVQETWLESKINNAIAYYTHDKTQTRWNQVRFLTKDDLVEMGVSAAAGGLMSGGGEIAVKRANGSSKTIEIDGKTQNVPPAYRHLVQDALNQYDQALETWKDSKDLYELSRKQPTQAERRKYREAARNAYQRGVQEFDIAENAYNQAQNAVSEAKTRSATPFNPMSVEDVQRRDRSSVSPNVATAPETEPEVNLESDKFTLGAESKLEPSPDVARATLPDTSLEQNDVLGRIESLYEGGRIDDSQANELLNALDADPTAAAAQLDAIESQFSAPVTGEQSELNSGLQTETATTADEPTVQTNAAAPNKANRLVAEPFETSKAAKKGIDTVSATDAAYEAATSPENDLPEPSEAQKEAGNYKKGHINIGGLDISVENPVGSARSGVNREGKKWSVKMKQHYGYIKRTIGADEEQVDVFVKDGTPQDFDGDVFVIDQVDPETGKFDEHKVMLGFGSEKEARDAYLANYKKDWKGLESITAMPILEFKTWARDGEQKNPVAVFTPSTQGKDVSMKSENVNVSDKEAWRENSWVQQAENTTVVSIGQLTPDDVKALNKAVKAGVLEKGKGGGFGIIKTVYGKPGTDFAGERNTAINKLKAIGSLEQAAVGHGSLSTLTGIAQKSTSSEGGKDAQRDNSRDKVRDTAQDKKATTPVKSSDTADKTRDTSSDKKPHEMSREEYDAAFPKEKDGQTVTAANGKAYVLNEGVGGKWWAQNKESAEVKAFASRADMREFLYGHASHHRAVSKAVREGVEVAPEILSGYSQLERISNKKRADRIFKFQADERASEILGSVRQNGKTAIGIEELSELKKIADKFNVTPAEVDRLVNTADTGYRRMQARDGSVPEEGSRPPKGKVLVGKDTLIRIPGEKTAYKARYVLRLLSDVEASHNAFNFNPNPEYWYKNDRHYDKQKGYQASVIEDAQAANFQPEQVVNNNPTAETGAPIIDMDGNALGGNSRVLKIERIWAAENPKAKNAYVSKIKDEAAAFGIDPADVAKYNEPFGLFREITEKGVDKQQAITDLNKVSAKDLSQAEAAIAGGTNVSDEALNKIADAMDRTGSTATITEMLNAHGSEIVKVLIDDGVFNENQRNTLIQDGKITDTAKQRVRQMLLGHVFEDLEQLEYAPASVKNNIEKVIVPLIKTQREAAWDILPKVREAIDLLTEHGSKGGKESIDNFVKQDSLVKPEGWSDEAIAIAKTLRSDYPVSPFKVYAGEFRNAETGSMFGTLSPEEAFQEAFVVKSGAPASVRSESKQSAPKIQPATATQTAPKEVGHGPVASAEQFQDYGEKIGGAKKDLYQLLDRAADKETLKTEPLSKAFPRPDFAKLIKNGDLTENAARFLSFVYDQIPAKPRKAYKVDRWVNQVQGVIDTFRTALDSKGDTAFQTLVIDKATPLLRQALEINNAWLDATGFPETARSMQGYEIKHFNQWKDMKGEAMSPVYSVVKDGRILGDYQTAVAAAEALKQRLDEPSKTTFNIYQNRDTKEIYIGKKGASGIVKLAGGFESVKDAREHLKTHAEELEQAWENKKYRQGIERKSSEEEIRIAKDWREGKDIATTKDFAEAFGFKGVEFGNWVKQGASKNERQEAINSAYDALMDLSELLDVPPKALSLNGELSLALGARGGGQASSHYEPTKVVINLTKTRGKGSLAHEWWHGLDNYFSRMRDDKGGMVTDDPRVRKIVEGKTVSDDTRVRKELLDAYKGIVDAIRSTEMVQRSRNMDSTRSTAYWSTMPEITARAFENYVIDKLAGKKQQNDYLANFRDMGDWAKTGLDPDAFPYPTKDEAPKINKAFDGFVDTLEYAETDQGVALRSKGKLPTKSESPLNLLYNERGEIDYEKLANIADGIESGRIEIKRIDQAGFREKEARSRIHAEASVVVGATERTSPSYGKTEEELGGAYLTTIPWDEHKKRVAPQEKALEAYARHRGIWFEPNSFNTNLQIGRGVEATVYRNESDPDWVVKRVGYDNVKRTSPQQFLDRLAIFNHLFPGTRYEVTGFTRDEKGHFQFVISQPYIDKGTDLTETEIGLWMKNNLQAFPTRMPIGTVKGYSNLFYNIGDTHGGNIIRSKKGNVYVIDAIPYLNEETGSYVPFDLRVNDPKILRHKATAEAANRLHNELPFAHLADVLDEATGGEITEAGELQLTPADGDIVRRLRGSVASARAGETIEEPTFNGAVLDAGTLREMASHGRETAEELRTLGYPASSIETLQTISANLDELAERSRDFGITYVFDEALPEERFHQKDLRAGRTDVEAENAIEKESAIFQHPGDLFNQDYGSETRADKISEIIAKLATGQAERYGWDKLPNFEAERAKIRKLWADGLIRNNLDADGNLKPDILKFKEVFDYAYNKAANQGRRAETEGVGTDTTRSVGGSETSRSENAGTGTDSTGRPSEDQLDDSGAVRDEQSLSTRAWQPKEGKLKTRKTVLSAEKYGVIDSGAITGTPRYYNVKSTDARTARAQSRIETMGVERAVQDAKQPITDLRYADEQVAFQWETVHLLNELAHKAELEGSDALAAGYQSQKKEVLETLAMQGTPAGRMVQAYDNVRREDARTVTEYVERRRRQNGYDVELDTEQKTALKESALALALEHEKVLSLQARIEELEAKSQGQTKLNRGQRTLIKVLTENAQAAMQRINAASAVMRSLGGTILRNVNSPQVRQTETPEFKRWFADSKVVDENGEPLVVYHGTSAVDEAIEQFGGEIVAGWFTENPDYAGNYTRTEDQENGHIYPVYLKLEKPLINPIDIDKNSASHRENLQAIADAAGLDADDLVKDAEIEPHGYLWELMENPVFIQKLKDKGYDGIIQYEFGNKTFGVFEPNQIKSAIGNRGTFDPNDPSILRSRSVPGPSLEGQLLNDLSDVGAAILFNGFYDEDVITPAEFETEFNAQTKGVYTAHWQTVHAHSMEKLADLRAEMRRQNTIDRVKAANPDLVDEADIQAKIDEEIAANKARSAVRREHRKLANDVLKAEGSFSKRQQASLLKEFERGQEKEAEKKLLQKQKLHDFLDAAARIAPNAGEEILTAAALIDANPSMGASEMSFRLRQMFPDLKTDDNANDKQRSEKLQQLSGILGQANKLRDRVHQQQQRDREAARGQTQEVKDELAAAKRARSDAQHSFDNLTASLEKPPLSIGKKVALLQRQMMVSAINTAANNLKSGMVTRGAFRFVDAIDLGVQKAAKHFGRELKNEGITADTRWGDVLGRSRGDDAGFKKYFQQVASAHSTILKALDEHPDLYNQLYGDYSSDIQDIDAIKKEKGGAIHKALDAGLYAYDKLSFANRWQEYFVRDLEALYALQLRLGQRGLDLATLERDGRLNEITADDWQHAIHRARQVTFALKPERGTTADKVLGFLNDHPVPSVIVAPFAKFSWNAWNMTRDWLPVIAQIRAGRRVMSEEDALVRDLFNPTKYTSREIANSLTGFVFTMAALGLVRALGDRDDWYYLRVPYSEGMGRNGSSLYVDMRQHPEFAPFLYTANKLNRLIEGRDLFNYDDTKAIAGEMGEVFLSLSYRQAIDQNSLLQSLGHGLNAAVFSSEREKSGEKAWYQLSKFAGERLGIALSPLRPMKNVADSMIKGGDLDLDNYPFTQGIERQIPRAILQKAGGFDTKKNAVTGEEKNFNPYSWLKPIGLNIVDDQIAEPQMSETLRTAKKLAFDEPYTPPVTAAEKKVRDTKRDIYREMGRLRQQETDEMTPEDKRELYKPVRDAIKNAVDAGVLSDGQGDRIEDAIGKSEVASIVSNENQNANLLKIYKASINDTTLPERDHAELKKTVEGKLSRSKTLTADQKAEADRLGLSFVPKHKLKGSATQDGKGKPDGEEFKNDRSFIDKILTNAEAIGADPVDAFNKWYAGETIRKTENGSIIVYRMDKDASQGVKRSRGAGENMMLDHTVPLQLGGDNGESNLKLVPREEWARYTPVENALGRALRSGKIDGEKARELMAAFKKHEISEAEINREIGSKLPVKRQFTSAMPDIGAELDSQMKDRIYGEGVWPKESKPRFEKETELSRRGTMLRHPLRTGRQSENVIDSRKNTVKGRFINALDPRGLESDAEIADAYNAAKGANFTAAERQEIVERIDTVIKYADQIYADEPDKAVKLKRKFDSYKASFVE